MKNILERLLPFIDEIRFYKKEEKILFKDYNFVKSIRIYLQKNRY